jgi:hypothetical protein
MAITVRKLDDNKDWTFGQGLANYQDKDNAIAQNVSTRLKSFMYDWFLDQQANIDWFNILGQKNNKQVILNVVKTTVLNTDGVISVSDILILDGTDTQSRMLQIQVNFTTIYNTFLEEEVTINGS